MKTLKENLLRNIGVGRIRLIKEWLDKYCDYDRDRLKISNDYVINSGTIEFNEDTDFTEFPDYIQFGVVDGDFLANHTHITSMKGFPKEVHSVLSCYGCLNLKSLEGCPQAIKDLVNLSECHQLTSLKGCPRYIKHDLDIRQCIKLKRIDDFPKQIGRSVFLSKRYTNTTEEELRERCDIKVGVVFA